MEMRKTFHNYRLHFSFEKIEKVKGVNSKIADDKHFLMWDFDDIPLDVVKISLAFVQSEFGLPAIHVIDTGKVDGYHAYCFKSCSWLKARTIIAATPNVDNHYVGVGIGRGYFTLRYTDIKGRKFQGVGVLPSAIPEDLSENDVNNEVEYTKRR